MNDDFDWTVQPKMNGSPLKILQIIPATGWHAHFRDNGGREVRRSLACWALTIDQEGGLAVIGMATFADDVCFCEDIEYYLHDPEGSH